MRRALRVVPALVCAGLIAAACSSSPSSHTSTPTTGGGSHKTTSTTATCGPPTTASTTSTTGITACAQVTASPGQTQGAAGTIVGTITLTPVGSVTCTMEGYPALARFGSSGAALPITVSFAPAAPASLQVGAAVGLAATIAGDVSQNPAVTWSVTQPVLEDEVLHG